MTSLVRKARLTALLFAVASTVVVPGSVAISSAFAQTTAAGDVTSSYETVQVADGIWAFISPEPKSGLVSGNSVAIAGDDGVVVVDTGMIPSLTKRMIAEIRTKTGKPVRTIVNTHWHWDHNLGNFVYRDAYPDVTIVSTEFTRASMADYGPKMLSLYQQRGGAMRERLHKQLEAGKNADGSVMTAEQTDALKALIHDVDTGFPEIVAGRIELPNTTFTDTLTLHLGRREVQVRFLGRGNTAGDAIVYVPDAKVLVTGDLLVGPIPFATGAYVSDWIATMKKLDALDATVIVPGHGPVEHDKTHLRMITALLESIQRQVQEAVKAGLTLEETRKKVDFGRFADELTAGIPSRKRNFDEYFARPVVESAYKQAKGEVTSESPFGQ